MLDAILNQLDEAVPAELSGQWGTIRGSGGHLTIHLPYYARRLVSTWTKGLVIHYHWLDEAEPVSTGGTALATFW